MASVAQNQIILQGLISNPAQIPNCEAWYDLSDANARVTTTANFTGTGTATSTLISTAFVGVATAFLSELAPGDSVYNGSAVLIGVILSVTNDTNAVLTANGAAAITGAAFQISKANPRIILLKDKSGNSEVNVLALNGVTGNAASAPNSSALNIIGDIDIRLNLALVSWSAPAFVTTLLAKWTSVSNLSYILQLNQTGFLVFTTSADGSTSSGATSSAAISFSAYSNNWVRVTRASATGNVNFFTSQDGVNWAALGTQQANTSGAIFAGTSLLAIGGNNGTFANAINGLVYRAQVLNGIAGTLVFDANFGTVAKLAASFSESSTNVATVTINTTGDLGARICGARDRVQLTPGKQRTLVGSGASVYALADGQNDYDKSAPFPLTQPASFYWVGQQKTWVSGAYIFDGATANSGAIIQTTSTPQLNLNAGSSVSANTGLAVATYGILTAIFNGALSFLGVNNATAVGGNAGAGTMNGITGSASGTPGNYGNTQEQEMVVYSVAHDVSAGNRIRRFLSRKWNIALGA